MKTIILLAIVIIALTSCNEIERITVNETKNKVESTEEDDKSVEESSIEKEAEKTTEEKDIESSDKEIGENLQSAVLLNPDGQTIEERYNPPEMCIRDSCYTEDNTDAVRGAGVFEKSLRALKTLNSLGYGCLLYTSRCV